MKVIVNKPKPVKPPPKTYDLVGLDEKQLKYLHYVVGNTSGQDDKKAGAPTGTGFDIFTALNNAIKE